VSIFLAGILGIALVYVLVKSVVNAFGKEEEKE
jgi:hypothetical protein